MQPSAAKVKDSLSVPAAAVRIVPGVVAQIMKRAQRNDRKRECKIMRGKNHRFLASARAVSPSTPGSALPPILVADDDEDDVFFIQRLIKKTGVENPVKVFDDGSEVVNYLGGARLNAEGGRLRCPRLLFLDLNMRGLGGFGFL